MAKIFHIDKSFPLTWEKEGILLENPICDIPKRRDLGKPRHLPEEVLEKLIEMPNRTAFAGLRDYYLKWLTVTVGQNVAKTRAERVVPLHPQVVHISPTSMARQNGAIRLSHPIVYGLMTIQSCKRN